MIDAVRSQRLDAAIVALPAPTNGLQVTPLGGQRAVAALPVAHKNAVDAELSLARLAGLALLPESAVERFATPGIRFLPLADAPTAFESAVVTRPGTESLAALAFLRAVSRTRERSAVGIPWVRRRPARGDARY